MDQLEPLLRTGKGSGIHHTWANEDESWRFYQGAMLSLAEPVGRLLARKVPVPSGARRLLDLGGGHGALGAAVCRAHPPLRSIVCELPAALPHARRLAEREGLTDVVEFRACDLAHDPWPEDADAPCARRGACSPSRSARDGPGRVGELPGSAPPPAPWISTVDRAASCLHGVARGRRARDPP